jgi:hypothetical protein
LNSRLTGEIERCALTIAHIPTSAAPAGPSSTADARLAAKLSDTRARSTFSSAGEESQTRNSRASTTRVGQAMPAYDAVDMSQAARATTPQT